MKTANRISRNWGARALSSGFTLLEMIVVIGIIAILAAMTVPAFKGLGKGNIMAAAQEQFVGDLAFARQQAVKLRTPVYVVFCNGLTNTSLSSQVFNYAASDNTTFGHYTRQKTLKAFNNLAAGQFSSYALVVLHEVGSQPGHDKARYLSPGWKSLPDGVIFPPVMLDANAAANAAISHPFGTNDTIRPLPLGKFPFPTVAPDGTSAVTNFLPFIAFDTSGRLDITLMNNAYHDPVMQPFGPYAAFSFTRYEDLTNALSHGSVFAGAPGSVTNFPPPAPDIVETPRGNYVDNRIVVNSITGRPLILRAKLP